MVAPAALRPPLPLAVPGPPRHGGRHAAGGACWSAETPGVPRATLRLVSRPRLGAAGGPRPFLHPCQALHQATPRQPQQHLPPSRPVGARQAPAPLSVWARDSDGTKWHSRGAGASSSPLLQDGSADFCLVPPLSFSMQRSVLDAYR